MRLTASLLVSLVAGTTLVTPALAQDDDRPDQDSRDFVEQGDRPTGAPEALRNLRGSNLSARLQQESPAQPESAPERDLDPRAVELLEAVADAIADGFVAEARFYAEGSDLLESAIHKSEGRWSLKPSSPDAERADWAVRYTGQGTMMNRSQPIDFDVLWQPDRVSWIDSEAQTFNVQRLRGNKSGTAIQVAGAAFDQARALAEGFSEALDKASAISMAQGGEVDGVACDAVKFLNNDTESEVVWYIGREDRLPRRTEIVLPENELMFGALRVDFVEPLAGTGTTLADDFRMFKPDGFEEKIAAAFRAGSPTSVDTQPRSAPRQAVGTPSGATWEITDTEGNTVTGADLAGRVSVMYFWGTWAPACKQATEALGALAEEFEGQNVAFHALAFREGDPATVAAAAEAQGHAWPVYPEADDAVQAMGIRRAPSFIVYGQAGELLMRSGRPQGDDYVGLSQRIRRIINNALEGGDQRDASAIEGGTRVAPQGVRPAGRPRLKDD